MRYIKIMILISIFIAMATIVPKYIKEINIVRQTEEVVEEELIEEVRMNEVSAYPIPLETPTPISCPYPMIDPTPYCEEYWFEGEFNGWVCYDFPSRCP